MSDPRAGMEIYHFLHQKQAEDLHQQRQGGSAIWVRNMAQLRAVQ